MRVKSCSANAENSQPIQLSDEHGCVLRPKMISKFMKIAGADTRASVVTYAFFHAFKFPDSMAVNIKCKVEPSNKDVSTTPGLFPLTSAPSGRDLSIRLPGPLPEAQQLPGEGAGGLLLHQHAPVPPRTAVRGPEGRHRRQAGRHQGRALQRDPGGGARDPPSDRGVAAAARPPRPADP